MVVEGENQVGGRGGKHGGVDFSTLIILLLGVLTDVNVSCSSVTVVDKVSNTYPENNNPSVSLGDWDLT